MLSFTNPLVSNPAHDSNGGTTQSESTTLVFGDTVLVAYNDSGSRWLNRFTAVNGAGTNFDAEGLGLGDVTGDGVAEIVLADDNGGDNTLVGIFSRSGVFLGSFTTSPTNFDPDGFAVGDVTGDGVADIVLADDDPLSIQDTMVGVFNMTGTLLFSFTATGGGTNFDAEGIGIGDANGDGVRDIILADDNGPDNTLIGMFTANGTFIRSFTTSAENYDPDGFAVGNVLAGDGGIVEIVLADDDPLSDQATAVGIYSITGVYQMSFAALSPATYDLQDSTNFDAEGLAVSDLNGDGIAEIVLADDNGEDNTLVGVFSASVVGATFVGAFRTVPNHDPDGFAVGDLTGDGLGDFVFADDDPLSIENTTVGVFGGPRNTGFARSTDRGATFTDLGSLPIHRMGDAGDPVLARDDSSGTVYLATMAHPTSGTGIQVFRSLDGGVTFTEPVNAAPYFGGFELLLDKPWLAVDNFAGPGQGNVYVAFTRFAPSPAQGAALYFNRSGPGGTSWGPLPSTLIATEPVQGANIVVGPDHAVYVFWWDTSGGAGPIYMRKSTDRGLTFGPTIQVAALLGTGALVGLEFRTHAFPQAAVHPNDPNQLYVVFNEDRPGPDRADVFFVQSLDGGNTWSNPVKVNDDPTTNDQFFPTLALTPDGTRLFVGFYDRRSDLANSRIEAWGAVANLAGGAVTFGPNFRISNESFPVIVGTDPGVPPNYMGDYDIADADNEFFYLSWGDNRSGTPDVRLARIPVTASVNIVIDAGDDPTAGDQQNDGTADTFIVRLVGGTLQVLVNNKLVINGPSGPVVNLTINGSGDNDTLDLTAAGGLAVIHTSMEVVIPPGGAPLFARLDVQAVRNQANERIVGEQQLLPILVESVARWRFAGIDEKRLDTLKITKLYIVDLPDSYLGLAFENAIWIDLDAAGHGWFIDPTPSEDEEFPPAEDSNAYGRIDLLTVLMHELGHLLGFEHDHEGDGLMAEGLATGVRRTPTPHEPGDNKA